MATTITAPDSSGQGQTGKRDFRQEITDRIVSMLQNGVAP